MIVSYGSSTRARGAVLFAANQGEITNDTEAAAGCSIG
jgi:hypothetical protein